MGDKGLHWKGGVGRHWEHWDSSCLSALSIKVGTVGSTRVCPPLTTPVPCHHPVLTAVAVLVQVPQAGDGGGEAAIGVGARQGLGGLGEGPLPPLQVQVEAANLGELALGTPLHVQGGTHQNVVPPAPSTRSG